MNNQHTSFNQRVNYGKQWRTKTGTLVRELARNQSNIVTIVSEFVFEQYKSPYYYTWEVFTEELYEA